CHELVLAGRKSQGWRLIRSFTYSRQRRMEFHTEVERQEFLSYFPSVKLANTFVVPHDRFMLPKYFGDRAQARRELALSDDDIIFLCIGFLKPHKGLDDAVAAIESVEAPKRRLYIVGSTDVDDPASVTFAEELAQSLTTAAKTTLVRSFLDDQS